MILFPFGVLVGPITAEFGWPRATLASAVFAAHVTGGLAMPFVGGLVDRVGVRVVALPAICVFSLVLAGVSMLPAVPALFVITYALLGIVGAGHSTLIYARAVSTWFDRRRGLALGLSLAGVGVGVAVIPAIARILVANYGWRGAYFGLGIFLFVLAGPAVALFVRDRPRWRSRETYPGSEIADGAAGMPLITAIGKIQFWLLAIVVLLVAVAVNGTIAHVVPLLADRGVPGETATLALSAAGFALILGRVLSGYCLDRFFAPYVAACFFLVPLCGIFSLSSSVSPALAISAAVLLGVGIGAEVDIMAFLLGRYFGLSHYGAVYGTLLAIFTFGSGVGPWLIALSFDHFHNYTNALIGCGVALVAASALVATLGPYKYA
jgi:MFS family permease